MISDRKASERACLLANLNSLPFDFVARQKIAGAHMNFFILKQLPVVPPDAYRSEDHLFIVSRVLELVYTATDVAGFATDLLAECEFLQNEHNDGRKPARHFTVQLEARKKGATERRTRRVLCPFVRVNP